MVAPDALPDDALATACVVLGRRDALRILERAPKVEGVLVTKTNRGRFRVDATSRMPARIHRAV